MPRAPRSSATDRALAHAIRTLLDSRAPGATICPSDAARAAFPDRWRAHMAATRAVAARLVAAGELEVTQRGVPVDVTTARGPVRLRRRVSSPR